jgi:hypothetical protein
MSEIITFMFEPAKLQMNCASASGAISLRMDARDRSSVEGGLTDTDRSVTRLSRWRANQVGGLGGITRIR